MARWLQYAMQFLKKCLKLIIYFMVIELVWKSVSLSFFPNLSVSHSSLSFSHLLSFSLLFRKIDVEEYERKKKETAKKKRVMEKGKEKRRRRRCRKSKNKKQSKLKNYKKWKKSNYSCLERQRSG